MPPRRKPHIDFPVDILVDSNENLPFSFLNMVGDSREGNRPFITRPRWVSLETGDYSLDGFTSEIAIERKSLPDFFGTLSPATDKGQRRDRFVRELERLNCIPFATVVVEAEISRIYNGPPEVSSFSPKSAMRSVLAWRARYPNVHWDFLPGRRFAEQWTFRLFLRFLMEKGLYKP